ncbi:MAG: hypothetical protein HFH41_00605 [Lachnospiraceae bacterium]|nr:hypothetical protein [Lachnospiraceae bacterium]
MEEKKKKGKRAYLEAFQKNAEGKYEYKGEFYCWQGTEQERRKKMRRLWVLCLVMLGAIGAAGSVEAPGTLNCAYVILPYVVEFVAGISVFWGLCRLSAGGDPLRVYVYQASAEKIPERAVVTVIGAAAALAGELIFLLQNGLDGKWAGLGVFLLLEGMVIFLTLELRRCIRKMEWSRKERNMESPKSL